MNLRLFFFLLTALCASRGLAVEPVRYTEEDTVIPTYKSGPADPNPMFFFGRDSQGAEGRIYPYPLYDNLTNQKGAQSYHLLYLENEYVKIGVAPELGGRLFSALDKTNGYDFVYRQHVIKPALIGLIGAWISGGIEWNIPHHHRASTFNPVQCREEDNADGSKTIWVGELEIRQRMRWAVGYTLHPGSSVLTCAVRIFDRTPLPNTMLCFANVAVSANENYQIIFPPSTQWVTFHKKSEFASWPIAHSRYAGADFTSGVDVSWYKNHLIPNSMFAWNYQDDFFAGYDHGKQAGTMSVADHHVVPGKKFWTWGNGPRGRMWDNILTDDDGPYIELMVGAYSDNQPDYSWLQPYETRAFEMHWYPFRDIDGVKNANLDAAVNLEVKDGQIKYGFCATKAFPGAKALLKAGDKILVEKSIAIDPAKPFVDQVALPAGVDEHDVRAALLTADGRELVAYSPVRLTPQPQPEAVKPPPAPKDIANGEELFLAGQRIDQFHNPTLDADPYWEEALRRDPGDSAAHTGLGLLDLRRAKYDQAEAHFRKALDRLTANYTAPKNAEPLYYLGVALKAQDKTDEAFDAFYKAAWSQEWKAPAYFSLAEMATARGDFKAALDFVDRSLDANALNVRAYGLKSAVLRHLNRAADAREVLAVAARKTDPLDVRLMAEALLAYKENANHPLFRAISAHSEATQKLTVEFVTALGAHGATAQELAAEFAGADLWSDGLEALFLYASFAPDTKSKISPIVYYYLGDFAEKMGDLDSAAFSRRLASQQSPEYVFPFQAELIPVLRRAIAANPQDARALYYLGNLLYDWQPAEAVRLWEKSAALDPSFPVVWRNLAQAYSHDGDASLRAKAIAALEKAVSLGKDAYPTHLAELDALYRSVGAPVQQRLVLLEQHRGATETNDEARIALINLKTFTGQADDAIALFIGRTFNLWEGGTRFNAGESWTNAYLVRGLNFYNGMDFRRALADFDTASKYPAQLRAGNSPGSAALRAQLAYWSGCAHDGLGETEQARACWTEAAREPARPARPSDALAGQEVYYYQALALRKLGEGEDKVELSLLNLESAVHTAMSAAPGSTRQDAAAMMHYFNGLVHAGHGRKEEARAELSAALAAAPDLLGAKLALDRL